MIVLCAFMILKDKEAFSTVKQSEVMGFKAVPSTPMDRFMCLLLASGPAKNVYG